MCTCRKDIEEKLLNRFKEQAPEATGHEARLQGYAIIFGDAGVKEKGCMPFKLTATYPLKSGGFKQKKTEQNMIFTCCPFCGVKYESGTDGVKQ